MTMKAIRTTIAIEVTGRTSQDPTFTVRSIAV